MKVNTKCVQNMYKLFVLLFSVTMVGACTSNPEFERIITEEYPALYEAVYARDAEKILSFTSHPDEVVVTQAWNAMINTPVEDVSAYVSQVAEANHKTAWASLWNKELSEDDVERLNEWFAESDTLNVGLMSALAVHGNKRSLDLLMQRQAPMVEEIHLELAYAIGRISMNVELDDTYKIKIIDRALRYPRSSISQAYLYGFYRSDEELSKEVQQHIIDSWINFYPDEAGANRYLTKMLMKDNATMVFHHFVKDEFNTMDIELALEMLRGIQRHEPVKYTTVALNGFVQHSNPLVVEQALIALAANDTISERIENSTLNYTALNTGVDARLRLYGWNSIVRPERYTDRMKDVGKSDPYLQNIRYRVLKKVWSDEEVFNQLVSEIEASNGLLLSMLMSELNAFWANVEDDFKNDERADIVKDQLFQALNNGDRAYMLRALITDEAVLTEDDYDALIALLDDKAVGDHLSMYSSVTFILKERYEERSNEFINELFAQNNTDLNDVLLRQEWEGLTGSPSVVSFRKIDWDRLAELGPNPTLILDTNKGTIKIKMDVYTAPATISGMDSLITSDSYDSVAFHRVVPNFVIQGGDVETGRGFGGPGYTVPTEGSAQHYFRGKAGVASSGVDTEGSQYFVMHTWAPHLNGSYTIYGEVISGMEVVDRITVGDTVIYAYWEE